MSDRQPGEVAIGTDKYAKGRMLMRLYDGEWVDLDGERLEGWVGARTLVTIDPEDAEQVQRLAQGLFSAQKERAPGAVLDLAAVLREFARPTPPKPVEPTGLGAVVETASGYRWLHAYCDEGRKQWIDKDGRIANYDEIAAVTVLSEGVPS